MAQIATVLASSSEEMTAISQQMASNAEETRKEMAPQVGLEPTTLRLTAGCSAIELLRSVVKLNCPLHHNIHSRY